MKKVLLVALTIFLSQNLFAQNQKDSTVIKYINLKKNFIELSKSSDLPLVKPYYSSILEYMSKNNMDPNQYYVWSDKIIDETTSVIIPICHYQGFKNLKEVEDKEENITSKEGYSMLKATIIGNLSGYDGNLELNKQTKKVISFKRWQ